MQNVNVLFVCLGNICRSPMAESIFHHLVDQAGLSASIGMDSAGTGSYHEGELPDPRTLHVLQKHGLEAQSRARQITSADFRAFDWILAMDENNVRDLIRWPQSNSSRVHLLRSFDPHASSLEVRDPYLGGLDGFERMFDDLEQACIGLLTALRKSEAHRLQG